MLWTIVVTFLIQWTNAAAAAIVVDVIQINLLAALLFGLY